MSRDIRVVQHGDAGEPAIHGPSGDGDVVYKMRMGSRSWTLNDGDIIRKPSVSSEDTHNHLKIQPSPLPPNTLDLPSQPQTQHGNTPAARWLQSLLATPASKVRQGHERDASQQPRDQPSAHQRHLQRPSTRVEAGPPGPQPASSRTARHHPGHRDLRPRGAQTESDHPPPATAASEPGSPSPSASGPPRPSPATRSPDAAAYASAPCRGGRSCEGWWWGLGVGWSAVRLAVGVMGILYWVWWTGCPRGGLETYQRTSTARGSHPCLDPT